MEDRRRAGGDQTRQGGQDSQHHRQILMAAFTQQYHGTLTLQTLQVKIGLIQNQVVLPTDSPIQAQVSALHRRIGSIIETAARAGVNIVCLQEAWSESQLYYSLSILSESRKYSFPFHYNSNHCTPLQPCPSRSAPVRSTPGPSSPSLQSRDPQHCSSPM